jgi:hypothetical protein
MEGIPVAQLDEYVRQNKHLFVPAEDTEQYRAADTRTLAETICSYRVFSP